jgi:DNA-binding response OmpR family regulator
MSRTILAVDDNPAALMLIRCALGAEGYTVVTAADGHEALRKAREQQPDLVVLDLMMPGIDGYEVCRRLRTDPVTAHMPVLILSAKSQSSDQKMGFGVGADDYLTKPVLPSELVNRIESLLFFGENHETGSSPR